MIFRAKPFAMMREYGKMHMLVLGWIINMNPCCFA